MAEDLKQLLVQAIETQIRDAAQRPTFNWTDGLSQMTLGIWATGTDAYNQPYLCLGEPEEEMGEETGNGGTIYLENFEVQGIHHGIGNTTRFDLANHTGGEYFVWVAGDWRPENRIPATDFDPPLEGSAEAGPMA